MAYLETVFIEGSTGIVLDSPVGTPNPQAVTVQGNAAGVPVPVSVASPAQIGNAPTSAVVGVSSVQILAANASRTACVITNVSYETISLAFDHTAVLFAGMVLGPGGSLATNIQDNFQGAVFAISTNIAGGGYVAIEEFN